MADDPTTRDEGGEPKSETPVPGMDEQMFARADAVVERNWLDKGKKTVNKYQKDPWFRAEASVKLSLAINAVYSIYQLYMGILFESVWFASLAIYSVMVTITRAVIVRYLVNDAQDGREEIERYRSCGFLLVMLTFAVGFLALVINFAGEHPVYPGSMIYVVAAFTLYTVYTSVTDLYKYRKLESPLISASKSVAVSCALVSLYSLQAAAVALYLTGDMVWLRTRLNLISAIVICSVILSFAVHIIVRAGRALAGKEDLSFVVHAKASLWDKENREEWDEYQQQARQALQFWQTKEGPLRWSSPKDAHERRDRDYRDRLEKRAQRRKT